MTRRALCLLVGTLGAAGCGDSAAPGAADAGPPPPPYAELYEEALSSSCSTAACHGSGAAGRLELSSPELAYAELIDVPARGSACLDQGWIRVVPGDPEASLLLAKLEDTHHCGTTMPAIGNRLSPEVIERVRAWIAAGAPAD